MKISTLIISAINVVAWGWLAWKGHGLAKGVQARVGHSDLGQVEFLVVWPLIALIVALLPLILLSQTKWAIVGNFWAGFVLALVVPYLLVYGGGV